MLTAYPSGTHPLHHFFLFSYSLWPFLSPSLSPLNSTSLSLFHFMLSSFPPLCLIPLLPHLRYFSCLFLILSALLPYFHDIPNHSVPFNSITCYSTLIPILFYSIPFQFIPFYSRDLSGGQKARVVFVELSLMAPHLLFLDVRHPSSHPYLLSLFQFSHCSCFTTVHFTRIQSLTGPCWVVL